MTLKALIFDCDGVLADTERDGHRVAFNLAFERLEVDARWTVDLYGKLLKVAGGKERLRRFFDENGWPAENREEFLARLHAEKTRIFQSMAAAGDLPLRPGIERIVDEALASDLRLAVCSTATLDSVQSILAQLGPERQGRFDPVLAGDMVQRKKPNPGIYLMALERLQLAAAECLVVEDSRVGMRAALAAGLRCLVTTSAYTAGEDFTGAVRVVRDLGEPPAEHLTVEDLQRLCR